MTQINKVPLNKDNVNAALGRFKPPKTQRELSEYLEIDLRSLSRHLNQGRTTKDNLIKMAKFLDCHPDYLSGKSDNDGLRFSDFDGWNYTVHDCVSGLLTLRGFSPRDFSTDDIARISMELFIAIEKYAIQHDIKHSDESEPISDADIAHPVTKRIRIKKGK